jgi:hypothetical protein
MVRVHVAPVSCDTDRRSGDGIPASRPAVKTMFALSG